jgi:hypothetical protein
VDEQRVVDELRSHPPEERDMNGVTAVGDFLTDTPTIDQLVTALCGGFESEFSTVPRPGRLTAGERADAAALEARYADTDWTWRR